MPKNQSSSKVEELTPTKIIKKINLILKNAKTDARMNLEKSQRQEIHQLSQYLTFAEKANLFINFITYPGTTLYDPGDVFQTIIRIDDNHSTSSKNRPLLYIESTDGNYSRVEIIDILESIKTDATNIGHPAITFAIHHWQKLLVWAKYTKDTDIYSKNEIYEKMSYELIGIYIESAKKNLEAVGKALLEGTRRNTIPKELALVMKIKELKLNKRNSYLYVAWERLASIYVNQTHTLNERIDEIENFLTKLPTIIQLDQLDKFPPYLQQYSYIDPTIEISLVIDFLKKDGKRFVYDETVHHSRRPQWRIFKNAFISYYFQKETSTIEQYRKIAKNQTIDEPPYLADGFGHSPSINTFRWLSYIFTRSLVNICEPIECESEIVNSSEFFRLVDQRVIK